MRGPVRRPAGALLGLACLLSTSGCPPTLSPSCLRLAQAEDCGACADGAVTCTLGDVSVTELSCMGCQAEVGLFRALCEQGSLASEEALDQRTCEEADGP